MKAPSGPGENKEQKVQQEQENHLPNRSSQEPQVPGKVRIKNRRFNKNKKITFPTDLLKSHKYQVK